VDYFYDFQLRRYLLQFMRVFSDFKYMTGPDANGLYTVNRTPIMYGDPSIMVAQIIKGASENTLMPSPMFSAYIERIDLATDRIQAPQYVGKVSTTEREFDKTTGTYTENAGVRYDIERYMPVPIDIYFSLDLWTTVTDIKFQLFEQIRILFNTSLQLQQNDNILDWTSIFELWLTDITWTNRNIQQNDPDVRDILTFKFKCQGWINPPAKIKRSSLISQIVTNVFSNIDIQGIEGKLNGTLDPFSCVGTESIQIITTPGNYKISVQKGAASDEITLLGKNGEILPELNWKNLFAMYGQIAPNITKLVLKLDPNIEVETSDIIGTIALDSTRENVLFYTPDIDTIPGATMLPVDEIIDPTEITPGNGLPTSNPGQRYLLTSATSHGEEPAIPSGVIGSPWGAGIVAYPNDIIQYNGTVWTVAFDSRHATGVNNVINNSNGSYYSFNKGEWTFAYYGVYSGGFWRIDGIINNPSNPNNLS
jgi:hypothetical protein